VQALVLGRDLPANEPPNLITNFLIISKPQGNSGRVYGLETDSSLASAPIVVATFRHCTMLPFWSC
jgi:hypothetical protein